MMDNVSSSDSSSQFSDSSTSSSTSYIDIDDLSTSSSSDKNNNISQSTSISTTFKKSNVDIDINKIPVRNDNDKKYRIMFFIMLPFFIISIILLLLFSIKFFHMNNNNRLGHRENELDNIEIEKKPNGLEYTYYEYDKKNDEIMVKGTLFIESDVYMGMGKGMKKNEYFDEKNEKTIKIIENGRMRRKGEELSMLKNDDDVKNNVYDCTSECICTMKDNGRRVIGVGAAVMSYKIFMTLMAMTSVVVTSMFYKSVEEKCNYMGYSDPDDIFEECEIGKQPICKERENDNTDDKVKITCRGSCIMDNYVGSLYIEDKHKWTPEKIEEAASEVCNDYSPFEYSFYNTPWDEAKFYFKNDYLYHWCTSLSLNIHTPEITDVVTVPDIHTCVPNYDSITCWTVF